MFSLGSHMMIDKFKQHNGIMEHVNKLKLGHENHALERSIVSLFYEMANKSSLNSYFLLDLCGI